MPLVSSYLQSGFLRLFKTAKPKTAQEAAQKFANVYNDYARLAMAASSTPVFTGLEVKKLELTLLPALLVPQSGTPVLLAQAWATGVMGYWFLPPIAFVGGQAGAVIQAATVVPIIVPGLTACFSNFMSTEEVTAATMASVLDAATRTVTVALTPPPGTIVPLV